MIKWGWIALVVFLITGSGVADEVSQKNVNTLPSIAEASEEAQPAFKNEAATKQENRPVQAKSMGFRVVTSLFIVLIFLGAAAYGFKKWPGAKKIVQKSRAIEVVAQHHLGPRRSLAVVRVAGESILIGVTENNINLIKTLSLLDGELPSGQNNGGFKNTLKETVNRDLKDIEQDANEEFSMQGLREIVSKRLKSMREL